MIYVDSLPFMWTKADLIPYEVDYYCAQKYPGYSMNPALESIKNFISSNVIIIINEYCLMQIYIYFIKKPNDNR